MLIATVEGSGPGAQTYFNHLDHLNSTNVVTNSIGQVDQILTYMPFGDTHQDIQVGGQNQSKRYAGHTYDESTGLNYMGARYYAGDTGRFTSQDPVSLALGDWKTVQEKTGDKLGFYLRNPQTHNSYSYTANNPLKYVDQNGEYIESAIDIGFIAYDLYKIGEAVVTGGDVKAEVGYLGLDIAGLAAPGGTGFGLVGRLAAKGGDDAYQAAKGIQNISKTDLKSIKGHQKQIQEHQQKLNDYIKNPDKFDNKGFLKNAGSNTELRNKIINSRINVLNKEIQKFEKNIEKIIKKYDKKDK